jgi:hypothetical protein
VPHVWIFRHGYHDCRTVEALFLISLPASEVRTVNKAVILSKDRRAFCVNRSKVARSSWYRSCAPFIAALSR